MLLYFKGYHTPVYALCSLILDENVKIEESK